MKNNTIRNFALLLAVMFALSSCAASKIAKNPNAKYIGEWEYVVEELPVDIDGTFVISEEEGVLKAVMVNPMGDMPLDEITIVEGLMKSEFEAQGNLIELEGKFDGDSYLGGLFVQGSEFVMKMTKKQ